MKKLISLLMSIILLMSSVSVLAFAENEYTLKTEDINIRDPYVLVYEGKYYMYGTRLCKDSYGCVVSEDLQHWSEPVDVLEKGDDFKGTTNFWAPECHYYNGKFYLFASYFSSAANHRGTAVFVSESPTGPFTQLGDDIITPSDRDCIDGTLYIDKEGQPWMIYVNEFTSNADRIGEMAAARLSANLDKLISEPVVLFRAYGAKWADYHIVDGPFLYRTKTGKLLMLWSNLDKKSCSYAVGIAESSNGDITGTWTHQPTALYQKNSITGVDGGHAMLFTDLNGQLTMAIHSPNDADERAKFIKIEDYGKTLFLDQNLGFGKNLLYNIQKLFTKIYFLFK